MCSPMLPEWDVFVKQVPDPNRTDSYQYSNGFKNTFLKGCGIVEKGIFVISE